MTTARVYFSHCMVDYKTERAKSVVAAIRQRLPRLLEVDSIELIDPSNHFTMAEFFQITLEYKGMDAYRRIVAECDALVYLPVYSRILSAGVAVELLEAIVQNKRTFGAVISEDKQIASLREVKHISEVILTIKETRDYIAQVKRTMQSDPFEGERAGGEKERSN